MATTYTLNCRSAAGEVAQLTITKPLIPLPMSTTWQGIGGDPVWGAASNGGVIVHGNDLFLGTGAGSVAHEISDFSSPIVGKRGNGNKATDDGSFPQGSFEYNITKID